MEFDTFVMARLLTGPNPPELDAAAAVELQDAHLAHIADMWASGALIAAGPASGVDGLRGISLFTCALEEAREMADRDPAVVAGEFVQEYSVWMAPKGMIVKGPGVPPRSVAEVRGTSS